MPRETPRLNTRAAGVGLQESKKTEQQVACSQASGLSRLILSGFAPAVLSWGPALWKLWWSGGQPLHTLHMTPLWPVSHLGCSQELPASPSGAQPHEIHGVWGWYGEPAVCRCWQGEGSSMWGDGEPSRDGVAASCARSCLHAAQCGFFKETCAPSDLSLC